MQDGSSHSITNRVPRVITGAAASPTGHRSPHCASCPSSQGEDPVSPGNALSPARLSLASRSRSYTQTRVAAWPPRVGEDSAPAYCWFLAARGFTYHTTLTTIAHCTSVCASKPPCRIPSESPLGSSPSSPEGECPYCLPSS